MRPPTLLPALAAALALAGASCRPPVAGTTPPPPVPTVTVARGIARTVTEYDDFVGRLESPQSVEIRARVSGYLEKVHFKEGGEVKQGDLLFTIDPRPYQATVDRFLADLDRAKIRAELARSEATRAEKLVASRAISSEEAETRVKALTEAEAAIRSAEAGLNASKLDLEFTSIHAPITGRIGQALVTPGNLVGGGTSVATLLTTLVALDPIYCYVEVDERSSLKYRTLAREGKRESALFKEIPARMGLTNESGFPHEGKIDFVDNAIKPDTGTIRARGVFPNADRLMAPGFFARLRIPGSGRYEAVLIRDSALGSDQGRPYVLVVGPDNKVQYRGVTTGPMEDGLRIIREGLKPDERIVITGLLAARPGATVNPTESEMLTKETAPAK
ncbi:MAG: mexE [Verrucomicrobiales bacterium]|nr:mexE [Verrucomicrobiales bacterium]